MKRILWGLFILSFSTASFAKEVKVGVVFDKAGKDDKSFNSSANTGAEKAKADFKIKLTAIETRDEASYEPSLETLASRGYDLVIGIGFNQQEFMERVAKRFPKVNFAIVDANVKLPNVASLLFEEQEGSFLVGMLASMKSKSGTVGFVGGMDIPLIRRFEMAYRQGALYANPKTKVLSNFAGITVDAFNDPTKGRELANTQTSQGADVIFAAAGSTNLGVFDAAEAKKVYAIGVDANQNWIKPGTILTSMLKRVDVAVYDTIRSVVDGKFQAGLHHFSLKNKGIDYAVDQFNEKLLTAEMKTKVDQAKQEIIAGKLKVDDYYLKK